MKLICGGSCHDRLLLKLAVTGYGSVACSTQPAAAPQESPTYKKAAGVPDHPRAIARIGLTTIRPIIRLTVPILGVSPEHMSSCVTVRISRISPDGKSRVRLNPGIPNHRFPACAWSLGLGQPTTMRWTRWRPMQGRRGEEPVKHFTTLDGAKCPTNSPRRPHP